LNQSLADKVCCATKEIYDAIIARYGTHDKKISLIHNSIDMEKFKVQKNIVKNRHPYRLLFVGRLTEPKGLPYLIKALPRVARSVPDVKLELVGNGNREEVLKLASKAGVVNHISMSGSIPHSSMPEVYSRADVLVFPSLADSHAKVPTEALACGLPVVGTNIGGVVETVKNEDNGLLVPPRDIDALAGALIRILTDNELYINLYTRSRRSVIDFSIEEITKQYILLYHNLTNYEDK
jgi:glycosyltransferase involved in cell wall biosynthesis